MELYPNSATNGKLLRLAITETLSIASTNMLMTRLEFPFAISKKHPLKDEYSILHRVLKRFCQPNRYDLELLVLSYLRLG
jgi:hypothetical protein